MTKLEKLMTNPDRVRKVITEHMKEEHIIQAILIGVFCPSEFGMKNNCKIPKDCEECWNQEVEE